MGASPTKTYKMPKGSGLTKPLALSTELADLVGAKKGEQLSRPEVVKRIWAYLKAHKLQDPENKQYFKPDAKMKPIFGEDKVRAFGMAKFLKTHVSNPNAERQQTKHHFCIHQPPSSIFNHCVCVSEPMLASVVDPNVTTHNTVQTTNFLHSQVLNMF